MKKIEIFEPSMCCSTGVCGPSVDPVLPKIAGDVDWLKGQGVHIERHNLSQEPQAFAASIVVKAALEKQGIQCLPLVVVDGFIVCQGVYPSREQLATWASLVPASSPMKELPVVPPSSKQSGCCGPNESC